LFSEGGFHRWWLAELLAGEDAVEPFGPRVDIALSAGFDEQSA
jgi:hypothetical protein